MYEQITRNKRRSVALFLGFFVLYGALASSFWWYTQTPYGAIAVLAVAAVVAYVAFGHGDELAVRAAGAREIRGKADAPELWRLVENLAIAAGLPMPRIFVSPDPSANAFAAGRDPSIAMICMNQGLLDLLDEQELEAVLAHEMSHIRNLDVRLMTYAAVLAGSLVLIGGFIVRVAFSGTRARIWGLGGIVVLLTAVLTPIGATLIRLSISRRREFVADASAAELTRYPQALASALTRISGSVVPPRRDERTIAHMMIAPQLTVYGHRSKLWATHPPTEDRIAALTKMASGATHAHGRPASETFLEMQFADRARALRDAQVEAARLQTSGAPPSSAARRPPA